MVQNAASVWYGILPDWTSCSQDHNDLNLKWSDDIPDHRGDVLDNFGDNMHHIGNIPYHIGDSPDHFGDVPDNFGDSPNHFINIPYHIGDILDHFGGILDGKVLNNFGDVRNQQLSCKIQFTFQSRCCRIKPI